MAKKDDTPMTPEETKAYILAHHKEQTKLEMAAACHKSFSNINTTCWEMGIKPVTPSEKRLAIFRAAEGAKTVRELALMAGISTSRTYHLCLENNIPYRHAPTGAAGHGVPKDYSEEDVSTWPLEKRQKELNAYVEPYIKKGFTRFEALRILHETAEYLMTFGEWKKSTIERPKAIYANQTRDQLIEELLKDSED